MVTIYSRTKGLFTSVPTTPYGTFRFQQKFTRHVENQENTILKRQSNQQNHTKVMTQMLE